VASIVLIEPYYGGSHRAWADGWVRHSRHEIRLVTHPDQYWRWRLRGGAVTLAEAFVESCDRYGTPDVVVVSGLVDVAAFSGIARRAIGDAAVAVYVHESQLLYPLAQNQRADSSSALINWQSLVAADAVWFNSEFHRTALRAALPSLLSSQPTPSHSHLISDVFDRSRVLYPGVETAALINQQRNERPVPRVLWNQRWDHDKNPHAVFAALVQMAEEGLEFTLALAGQNQRPDNPDFAWVRERLDGRIDHHGYADDRIYQQLLINSDVVVSAADHEFFGIALVEAIAGGSVPVLPHRLSFPELVNPQWHEAVLYGDGDLRTGLRRVLSDPAAAQAAVGGLRESMARFDAPASAEAHDDAVDALR